MYTVASSRHAEKYYITLAHDANAAMAWASLSIAATLLASPPSRGRFTAYVTPSTRLTQRKTSANAPDPTLLTSWKFRR